MKFFRTATGAKATYNVLSFRQHPWFIRNGNRRGRRLEVAEDRKNKQCAFFAYSRSGNSSCLSFFRAVVLHPLGLKGCREWRLPAIRRRLCWCRNGKRKPCPFQKLRLARWLPFILSPKLLEGENRERMLQRCSVLIGIMTPLFQEVRARRSDFAVPFRKLFSRRSFLAISCP